MPNWGLKVHSIGLNVNINMSYGHDVHLMDLTFQKLCVGRFRSRR